MICNGPRSEFFIERVHRVVLIADIVESVRLIEADEEGVVKRWLNLVRQIENDLIPANRGNLVKSLGDGLLLEFEDARTAVLAAFTIQQASARDNHGMPPDRLMLLRIGIEESDIIINEGDVFGHGVNLAARLASLAGPGETVVSAAVREQITPDLDADVEDLGECFLKHVKDPVRAYRIHPPGAARPPRLAPAPANLFPTVAVIPFAGLGVDREHEVLGEILAEELIRDFSRSPDLHVISRLSTTAFRHRIVSLDEVRDHLSANYVLSGSYRIDGDRIHLYAELADARSSGVVWSGRVDDKIGGIISGDGQAIMDMVGRTRSAIVTRELQRVEYQSLPNLESYSILIGAIMLMHRMNRSDFERARGLLQGLIDRSSRQAIPSAWLAKWHVLRWYQGWSSDVGEDADLALAYSRRALDAHPESSLALSIDGLVHTFFARRLDIAMERYRLAVEANPNDPLAWIHKGALHAFMNEGNRAVQDTSKALERSPLDLHRYYYDSLAATAANANSDYELGLKLAERSLRVNKMHVSTLRTKAIAQWQLGMSEEARRTGQELCAMEPSMTVSGWLSRSPAADYDIGKEWAKILEKIGIPK
jgi:class 3 adenylate cyclase/tetratricopeptide (TPR) repeat protein